MKKRKMVPAVLFAMSLGLTHPALGWDIGCTPGYWKQPQHADSWVTYSPDQTLDQVFGCGGDTTLLEALNANGGGIYALQRHAVAALLNSTAVPNFDYTTDRVKQKFCSALDAATTIESVKNAFEVKNDGTCPLN